jgi:excisionase family DNA binding protein
LADLLDVAGLARALAALPAEDRRALGEALLGELGRPAPDAYLTVTQAAGLLGCHRDTVLARIHDGRLPALMIGERDEYRIARADLEALAVRPRGGQVAGPRGRKGKGRPRHGEFTALARGYRGPDK